jgi:hypothetical protein
VNEGSRSEFLSRVLIVVGVVAFVVVLLLLLWVAAEVVWLLFAGLLLAVFLRALSKPLTRYLRLPDPGCPTELVCGVVVAMNPPGFRHGRICTTTAHLVHNFAVQHDRGRVTSNDAGIITRHDPDTVRGADVAFYSYSRLPKDQNPEGYPSVAPEIVFEVLSPGDVCKKVL